MIKRNVDELDAIVQLPEHEFEAVPAELDERMAGLFATLRERELNERALIRRRKVIRFRNAVAAALAVILFVSFVGPEKVWTASQDAMAGVIRTVKSYSTLRWKDGTIDTSEELMPYHFTYLPTGMKIVQESSDEAVAMALLRNDTENNIAYLQRLSSDAAGMLFDTEQASIRMLKEEDRLYYYYVNKDNYNIIWEENSQVIYLSSNLDFDILFEVARGIIPKE